MTPNSDGSSENLGNEGGNSWWYKEVEISCADCNGTGRVPAPEWQALGLGGLRVPGVRRLRRPLRL
jgi:hypothetical protein